MVSIVTDNIPKFEEVPDPLMQETEPDLDFDTPAAAHRAKHEQNIDELVTPNAVKVNDKLLKPDLAIEPISNESSGEIKRQIAAEDIKTPGSNVSEPAIITG